MYTCRLLTTLTHTEERPENTKHSLFFVCLLPQRELRIQMCYLSLTCFLGSCGFHTSDSLRTATEAPLGRIRLRGENKLMMHMSIFTSVATCAPPTE